MDNRSAEPGPPYELMGLENAYTENGEKTKTDKSITGDVDE